MVIFDLLCGRDAGFSDFAIGNYSFDTAVSSAATEWRYVNLVP